MQALLFGASDSYSQDQKMQITVAFNHFGKRMIQRMPRCRWGYIHVVNNDYTHWNMYAIGGSRNPTIISQGNRYVAPPDNQFAKEVLLSSSYCILELLARVSIHIIFCLYLKLKLICFPKAWLGNKISLSDQVIPKGENIKPDQ